MQRTLRYKINVAILITFIVISFIFISIQSLLQNRSRQSISREIAEMRSVISPQPSTGCRGIWRPATGRPI